jgi:hypothetical protein
MESIDVCPYCADRDLPGGDACPVCGRTADQPTG